MQIERANGESQFEYHKRIIYGKLVDHTLADYDYAELAALAYGKDYSPDVARRMMYGSRQTLELLDESRMHDEDQCAISDELDMKMAILQKERQKFYDQRAAYTKLLREEAREEEIREIIRECAASGKLREICVSVPEAPYREYADNTLLVSLNDLHYGAEIKNAWCQYDPSICEEMMRGYLRRIIEIAALHKSEDCVVWSAGDHISGNIHRSIQVSNKEDVIAQVMGVSELIAQFLAELSGVFRTVRFVSVAGNHSRIEANKEQSLTAERLDNLVEWYLAARLQNFENVIIADRHKIDHTISLFSIRGKNYCMVHGDFDSGFGSVQSLQAMAGCPLYAVLCGHKHHNHTDTVQGIKTIMAGSFQGMDRYCIEKRIVSLPEQMVCVCGADGIECHYDVPLERSAACDHME